MIFILLWWSRPEPTISPSYAYSQAFDWLDETHPSLPSHLIQTLTSSRNSPANTPGRMSDQMFRCPMAQSGWHIRWTITSISRMTRHPWCVGSAVSQEWRSCIPLYSGHHGAPPIQSAQMQRPLRTDDEAWTPISTVFTDIGRQLCFWYKTAKLNSNYFTAIIPSMSLK